MKKEELIEKYRFQSVVEEFGSSIVDMKSGLTTDLNTVIESETKHLKDRIKELEFMITNGLGWEDMRNDITLPHEI